MSRVHPGLFMATLSLAFSFGCMAKNVSPRYTLKEGTKGLVILALTQSGHPDGWRAYVRVRPVGANPGEAEDVWFVGGAVKKDYYDQMEGRLLCWELEEGEYEIFHWVAERDQGKFSRPLETRDPISFRFKAVGGKAVYAGSLHVQVDPAQETFQLMAADKRERDLALLSGRLPNVEKENIVFDIMKKD
ncbi:MAG: hypothetical protein OEZ55_13050 [Nitrospinota bacterium]|nr:hypothetical protein [Nitrospinota bacterium]